jgi:hypothetical protein
VERDDFVYKVLNFKEKIGMIPSGDWVCIDIKSGTCYMSLHKKDLRPIGVVKEAILIEAINSGKVEITSNCKFRYRAEKVGANK